MKAMLLSMSVCLTMWITQSQANAGECYGSFTISNTSGNTIHYQVQWGDGEWKSYSICSGIVRHHYHPLDADGRAPVPNVRFDYIANDNEVTYKTYKMDFYAVHEPSKGKPYEFRYSRCGCYLNLYSK